MWTYENLRKPWESDFVASAMANHSKCTNIFCQVKAQLPWSRPACFSTMFPRCVNVGLEGWETWTAVMRPRASTILIALHGLDLIVSDCVRSLPTRWHLQHEKSLGSHGSVSRLVEQTSDDPKGGKLMSNVLYDISMIIYVFLRFLQNMNNARMLISSGSLTLLCLMLTWQGTYCGNCAWEWSHMKRKAFATI